MKKHLFVILLVYFCFGVLIFSACKSETVGDSMNNSAEIPNIFKREYEIADLKNFFEDNDGSSFNTYKNQFVGLSYAAVNKHFPIEIIRPGGYSIYKVKSGGYYYVFWSKLHLNEDNQVSEDAVVYLTSYISKEKDVSVFDSLKIGVSTASDVMVIDPYSELSFFMSSGIFSYSFLNDENILEIEYESLINVGDIVNLNQLVVKNIKIISRKDAPSRYSLILSKDIPKGE